MAGSKPNFEVSLTKLEKIVEQLETEELGLEESLRLFEEGIKVSKKCEESLKSAELKVKKLLEDGKTLVNFDQDQSNSE
ncbi:MAG: exodeoxyribonuclease VII small subunit [Methylococcaceae bacterium TMED69]|nr:MAG: exodeoxyribonuclease VII small subunit [Methylococcaceae bacterium TMED69]|tara:strand:- start:1362 stop:1598 length:237 start_codon:yes stop_codon:yes gene_type:complete